MPQSSSQDDDIHQKHTLSPSLSVTVRVGFESVVYSQRESRGAIEVCVEVASPAVAERQFFLLISSSDRDAGTASTVLYH